MSKAFLPPTRKGFSMMPSQETPIKKTWSTPRVVVFGTVQDLTRAPKAPVKLVGPGDDFIVNPNSDLHLS